MLVKCLLQMLLCCHWIACVWTLQTQLGETSSLIEPTPGPHPSFPLPLSCAPRAHARPLPLLALKLTIQAHPAPHAPRPSPSLGRPLADEPFVSSWLVDDGYCLPTYHVARELNATFVPGVVSY